MSFRQVLPRAHVRFISQIATHASMSEQEAIFVSSWGKPQVI